MPSLIDRLPWYAWAATLTLAAIAGGVFFVPASVALDAGLSIGQFILLLSGIELAAAIGIAAIIVHYRAPIGESDSEWTFNP